MSAVDLVTVPIDRPDDLSALASLTADDVVALVAKTEGNGCVNDFSRMLAARAWEAHLPREAVTVFSGGTEGVLSPHANLFVRWRGESGGPGGLVAASGRTAAIAPQDLGRRGQAGAVAEVVAEVALEHPGVELRTVLVDAMAAFMVQRPEELDVLVCSNLFGDVLSDLAAAVVGGLGMAPSGNIGTGTSFGLFEPVHGSAPDIAGQGRANPVACILSGAMMLDHLGLPAGARAIRDAVADTLADPRRHTPDLGGTSTTGELAGAVLEHVESAVLPPPQDPPGAASPGPAR